MTDRELLELAAQAAGISVGWSSSAQTMFVNGQFDDEIWNPLTDDGDALRLAVKLRMDITFDAACVGAFPEGGRGSVEPAHDDDPCAATRRAIVRAAAEIGMGMP